MGKCRHEGDRMLSYMRPAPGSRIVFVDGAPRYTLPEQRVEACDVCQDCGEWLSLGPSNDEGQYVQFEIELAETIARTVHDPEPFIEMAWFILDVVSAELGIATPPASIAGEE